MTSPNNDKNDDILENLDKKISNDIKSSQEINKDDLISMFDLPENDNIENKENIEKSIYDININSLNDILLFLEEKKYDFVTFEPNDNEVKIDFRKNSVVIETKYIKFPIYSSILLKAKSITKLKLDEINETQE
jgi:type II secretory ATPase GspE/PulE/Tfp pilus assembly ATPase PilB-like protein